MKATIFMLVALLAGCLAQRGSYAGTRPIGYPEIEIPVPDPLADRFGEDTPTTTIRLPVEVLGDVNLYNRLKKLPLDQQPFWLLNWEALEALRKNPQSYEHRDNSFVDKKFSNRATTVGTK